MMWGALALLPLLSVAFLVMRDAVNLPYWDQWALVPMFSARADGHFPWDHLTASHNGHRILLPRLLFLGLGRMSAWDVRWEQAASLVVVAGTLGILALLARRTFRSALRGFGGAVVGATSLLVYSLHAWENWAWGFQIQLFLVVFFAALLALLAAHSRGRLRDLAGMWIAATLGAFSFGAGLVLYPLVVVAVLLHPAPLTRRARWLQASATAALGIAVIVPYMQGAPRDLSPFEHGFSWVGLRGVVGFDFAFLGGALTNFPQGWAITLGVLGAAGLSVLAARLWTRAPQTRADLLPWLLLGVFAISAGVLTGLGRAGAGVGQALVPRYATLATPLWIALSALAALGLRATSRAAPARLAAWAAVAASGATLVAVQVVRSSAFGLDSIRSHGLKLREGQSLLLSAQPPPPGSLGFLFVEEEVRRQAPNLLKHRLSVFKHGRSVPELADLELVHPARIPGSIDSVRVDLAHEACVLIEGWALHPETLEELDAILITMDGIVLGTARPETVRKDVLQFEGLQRSLRAGWQFHVRPAVPSMLGGRVEAFGLLPGNRIFALQGAQPLLRKKPQ